MKVCLISPPRPFLIDQMSLPALGILYLSSVLKLNGYEVQVADLALDPAIPDADVYGITCTTPTYPYAKEIGLKLKQETGKRVIIGGPHATVNSQEILNDGFHACVGEGEKSILEMLERPNVVSKYSIQIEDLDSIPFPDRLALPMDKYTYSIDGIRAASMMTSRGCPYSGRCAFCCVTWQGARYRTAANVFREAWDIKRTGIEAIVLYDDEMFVKKERDLEIARGFKALGLIWRCFTRSNLVTEELVRSISKYNCREVLLGIESGSNRVLKSISKGTTREMNLRAIRLLKKYGIRVKVALVVGLPSEDEESLKETDSFCEEAEASDYDFCLLTVYSGSPIAKHPERYDLQFTCGHGFYKSRPGNYSASVRTTALTSEQLVEARSKLERKFKPVGMLK